MTVKELIEKLKEFPEDQKVTIPGRRGRSNNINQVREGRHAYTKGTVVLT